MQDQKQWIIEFISQTFVSQKKEKVVVAVSGGIDSAVSLTLVTKVLGSKNVFPVMLPYGDQTTQEAKQIIKFNQIPESNWREINIKESVDQIWEQMDGKDVDSQLRRGNIMARVRMIVVYDLAKQLNALVCGTENKSEHELGYYTRFGDQASDLEPIVHLYKTQVRQLARFLKLPQQIINQAPSAGLWSGQTDEQELGFSYLDADKVLSGDRVEDVDPRVVDKVKQRVKNSSFKTQVPYQV